MTLLSQTTWDNIPEDEKNKIRDEYAQACNLAENGIDSDERITNFCLRCELEKCFGKNNLKPNIKTWEDIENNIPEDQLEDIESFFTSIRNAPGMEYGLDNTCQKLIATYKISRIIELGYGGMVSNKDNNDQSLIKYFIYHRYDGELRILDVDWLADKTLGFYSKKQAEDFISHPENVQLVKQYYYMPC